MKNMISMKSMTVEFVFVIMMEVWKYEIFENYDKKETVWEFTLFFFYLMLFLRTVHSQAPHLQVPHSG